MSRHEIKFKTKQGLIVTLHTDGTEASSLQYGRVYAYIRNDEGVFPASVVPTTQHRELVRAGWHLIDDSTAISAVKWEPTTRRYKATKPNETVGIGNLVIEFKDDRSRHRYFGLTEPMVRSLLDAPSKGKFFGRQIKGKFSTERLD